MEFSSGERLHLPADLPSGQVEEIRPGGAPMLPSGLGSAQVYLAAGATDLRKSFDGLAQLVRDRIREDPWSGALYVFCNRGRNRLRILYFDGTGPWVFSKRLEQGTFRWPDLGEDPKSWSVSGSSCC